MLWDAALGQLKCESCGATRAAHVQLGARIVEHDLAGELGAARPRGAIGAGTRQMRCNECGAVVVFPANVTATRCEFCDSPAVLAQEIQTDRYLPESLLPFGIDKNAAVRAFKDWLGRLWFRPSDLKEKASVDQLHGVYVPFWTFDCAVRSDWTAEAGYYYYETEHYTVTVNGKSETRTRQVRKVRWTFASGHRNDSYDDHLVCASRGLPAGLARKVADFDTKALVPYTKEVLSGYAAESYAIDLPEGWSRAQAEIADEQESRCARDVPGDTHRNLRASHKFSETTFKHVLLPVWLAAYRYRGEVFRFLVNGQTGQVAGTAPWSVVKIVLASLLAAALVVAAVVLYQH
jgi:hypothetical protein